MKWTNEQIDAINSALDFKLSTLFITGEGGSGKSEVIQEIKNRYPSAVLLAPTNSAANRIGGQTIYKFLSSKPGFNLDAEKEDDIFYIDLSGCEIKFGDILIIDEVSMLGKNIFKKIMSFIKFKKVILVGDPKQLPPVKDIFFDFEKYCSKTVRLTKNFRATNENINQIIKRFRDEEKLPKDIRIEISDVKYDLQTYFLSFNNYRLSEMQEKILGYPHAKIGDKLRTFSQSEFKRDDYDAPYFVTNDIVECISNPEEITKNLWQIKVKRIDNIDFRQNKFVDHPTVMVGNYDDYKNELEKRFKIAQKFKKELSEKYGLREVANLKLRMNNEESIKWEFLWRKYFAIKNSPYARHHQFMTTYKSQGLGLEKVIVDWKSLPNFAHKYVAISRAKLDLKALIF